MDLPYAPSCIYVAPENHLANVHDMNYGTSAQSAYIVYQIYVQYTALTAALKTFARCQNKQFEYEHKYSYMCIKVMPKYKAPKSISPLM